MCVLFTEKKRKKFLNKITHTDSCRKQKQTEKDGGKLCNHHINPDLKYAWNSEEFDVLLSCTQTIWQKESLIYAYLWLYRMPGATDFNPAWYLFWLKLSVKEHEKLSETVGLLSNATLTDVGRKLKKIVYNLDNVK